MRVKNLEIQQEQQFSNPEGNATHNPSSPHITLPSLTRTASLHLSLVFGHFFPLLRKTGRRAESQGHHAVDRLEERRRVSWKRSTAFPCKDEKGPSSTSSDKNGNCFQGNVGGGKLQREWDGLERIWAFPSDGKELHLVLS